MLVYISYGVLLKWKPHLSSLFVFLFQPFPNNTHKLCPSLSTLPCPSTISADKQEPVERIWVGPQGQKAKCCIYKRSSLPADSWPSVQKKGQPKNLTVLELSSNGWQFFPKCCVFDSCKCSILNLNLVLSAVWWIQPSLLVQERFPSFFIAGED